MAISIKHSLCIYALVLAISSAFSFCSNGTDAPLGEAQDKVQEEAHKNAPVVSQEEAAAVSKKIEEINATPPEIRRLVIDGMKGEAEITYNRAHELVKISTFLKTESGTEREELFFENELLFYSTHNS